MVYGYGMAWTYSDWRSESSDSARLTRLRLYLQELEDFLTADSTSSHGGVNFANIQARIKSLEEQERALAKKVETLDSDAASTTGAMIRGIPK